MEWFACFFRSSLETINAILLAGALGVGFLGGVVIVAFGLYCVPWIVAQTL